MDNSYRFFVNLCRALKGLAVIALPVVFAVPMVQYTISRLDNRTALDIYVNGAYVGAVESSDDLIAAKRMLEKNLSASIGDSFRFTDEITYSFVSGDNLKYLSDSELYSALYNAAKTDIHPGYGLYVDGALVAATENRPALDRAVNDIKEYFKESVNFYAEEENIRVSYANDITIVQKDFPVQSLVDENRIRRILGLAPIEEDETSGGNAIYNIYYSTIVKTVKKNEKTEVSTNVIGIAAPEAPKEEADVVAVGKMSNASTVDVTIDYVITKQETVEEEVSYEIERIESENYLLGSEKVEELGRNGFRRATYEVSYQNGEEVSRQLIDEEILEPVENRIIYVGTRIPSEEELATTATGTFILPYDGYISSPYGLRTVSAFGTREFHNAWDIPGRYGSDILASDGGVVTKMGYTSGYGLHVIIDHENGYETLYAHLSGSKVNVGDRVGQGDVIAYMGASGRVTGVHVHFEIRKDGATIDPIVFIPDVHFRR